jgi:hypothetical protein
MKVDAQKVWEALCNDPAMPTVPNGSMIRDAIKAAGYDVDSDDDGDSTKEALERGLAFAMENKELKKELKQAHDVIADMDKTKASVQEVLKIVSQSMRDEYDASKLYKDSGVRNTLGTSIRRLAHRLVGKFEFNKVPVNEVKFLNESCDGQPGEF